MLNILYNCGVNNSNPACAFHISAGVILRFTASSGIHLIKLSIQYLNLYHATITLRNNIGY
jgi:hypothetical protein